MEEGKRFWKIKPLWGKEFEVTALGMVAYYALLTLGWGQVLYDVIGIISPHRLVDSNAVHVAMLILIIVAYAICNGNVRKRS
jgi:hypothetical protein